LNKLKYFLLLFFLGFTISVKAVVRDVVESIKVLRINSISQKIIDLKKVIFEGNVEVFVDNNLHMWADRVEIDKNTQTVIATANLDGFVKLETPEFLMLADRVFLNLNDKTGYADNIKVHLGGRFVSAKKAERRDEDFWKFSELIYTPCDCTCPHWHLRADEAKLHKYVLKGKGLSLRIKDVPIFFIPKMVLPGQTQSKSGFLVPKFSYDKRLGFGFRQEYYWEILPRFDTTFGLNWKNKKGYVIYDEVRYGRSSDNYTLINSKVAREKNAFIEKDFRIIPGKEWRCCFQGEHYQPLNLGKVKLDNLVHVDVGTDKRIGYDFLNKPSAVEDDFYNAFISRWHAKDHGLVSLTFDRDKIFREDFTFPESNQTFEVDERLVRCKSPHLEWDSSFYSFNKIFKYKHNLFVDNASLVRKRIDKIIESNVIVSASEVIPRQDYATMRFFYEGVLQSYLKIKKNNFRFEISPNIQFRSKTEYVSKFYLAEYNARKGRVEEMTLGKNGSGRIFASGFAEWALPEYFKFSETADGSLFFQPIIYYKFIPKVKQKNWGFIDHWDRVYPTNQIGIEFRNNWCFQKGSIGLVIGQAYDFYNRNEIFYLSRPPYQNHLMPFKIDFSLDYDFLHLSALEQFDIKKPTLFDSEIEVAVQFNKFDARLGWIYQDKKIEFVRHLLADVPSFYLFGLGFQLSKILKLSYEGQFFSTKNSLTPLGDINSLCHRLDMKFNGHCWGLSLGLEEKRFREQGIIKSERGFVLSFKLESLGSIGSRFRAEPQIIEAPEDY